MGLIVPLSPHAISIFALAAVSNARTGRRSYNPELGRWINRDPIGESDGGNILGFVHNGPVSATDHLGLITVADLQADLTDAQAAPVPYAYYAIGFPSVINSRLRPAAGIPYKIFESLFSDDTPRYIVGANWLVIPPGRTYFTSVHELVHVHVNVTLGLDTQGWRFHEGIAYVAEDWLYLSSEFRFIEKYISQISIRGEAWASEKLSLRWGAAWAHGDWSNPTNSIDRNGTHYPLAYQDVVNVAAHLGLHLSCKRLADWYNDQLVALASCLRFTCDDTDAGPGLIRPGRTLPAGVQ